MKPQDACSWHFNFMPSPARGNKPYFGKYALQILEEASSSVCLPALLGFSNYYEAEHLRKHHWSCSVAEIQAWINAPNIEACRRMMVNSSGMAAAVKDCNCMVGQEVHRSWTLVSIGCSAFRYDVSDRQHANKLAIV